MATAYRTSQDVGLPEAGADAGRDAGQFMSLLRFITCGSVDDGKSTLLGRILYDSNMLLDDQLAALEQDSRKSGTQGEGLDFALLVDGLSAEREQGITIDVAYRFFATARRKFIVADTPGHEQYTRNMATGASTADLAIILIDARQGVLTQTRRHSLLVSLLGIRSIVVAVNKMDMVGYGRERFERIVADYRAFADEAGIGTFTAIPLSALNGENVAMPSRAMPWYEGPTLLAHLETVPVAGANADRAPFAMPVQWVNRPHSGFRGYAGRIAGGAVSPGDAVTVLPSGRTSRIERIVTLDGDLDVAVRGQSVTLTLADEVDCARGDVIVAEAKSVALAETAATTLLWMSDEALVPGRAYWLKTGARTVSATISRIDHVVDMATMAKGAGRPLGLNDIGGCTIDLDQPVAATSYADNHELGSFILIDKISNATIAAGLINGFPRTSRGREEADPEASGILWVAAATDAERAALAQAARQRLQALGRATFILDDVALAAGLNADLGREDGDAGEELRRLREVARLMSKAGIHVLVTRDVPADEAWPGRRIAAADIDQEGTDEWVI